MPTTDYVSLLGLVVSGDVDGLTIYTDRRGHKIAYAAAPPAVPPSALQLAWRNVFRHAMTLWRSLPQVDRDLYRRVCDDACLCMLGHNLWLHIYITQDYRLWSTLKSQYHLPLAQPPGL